MTDYDHHPDDLKDRYAGPDLYVRTAEDFLDVDLTAVQRRILRAVGEHQRVHIQSGNGVGKSFTAGVLNLAFLIRHPGSTNMATSGSYSVLSDVLWKPMRKLFGRTDLPGRCLENLPRVEIDDDWYFKATSPRYPGNLEGRHAGTMLVTIEEVDKPDITQEHFNSAESMLTSEDDRILAISNPPADESNVAAELAASDRWHTIEFSSFESRNVKVDAGETGDDRIPGLVDLDTITDDWENWNGEPWPGLETARTAHRTREDLDTRWYRRRAGVMPPSGSAEHRPIEAADASMAWDTQSDADTADEPSAVGIDVARSGDHTVMIGVHGDELRVHYAERGANHATQEPELRKHLDQWPEVTVAIDAVGEGSVLGDRLQQVYPDVHRFKAGATADEATEYKDCWAEGLAELGAWLADGGTIDDHHLREELLAAARTVTFNERHLARRGSDGATVLQASAKRAVKDQIGRSPDYLDAALMACWADAGHATTTRHVVRRGPPGKRETGTAAGSGGRVRRRSGAGLTSNLGDSS